MKVLLVGNYQPDRQDSMQLYAAMLRDGLSARGHTVELLHPPAILGRRSHRRDEAKVPRRRARTAGLDKWLGYADKFLLFKRSLRQAAARADVVHLCDHSNAMYVPAIARFPHVVTCHDLLAIRSAMGHFPQNRVGGTGRIFQRLIARGLKRAQIILCVSAKTRDDLRDYLHIPESRLRVVANALNYTYAPMPAEQREPWLRPLGLEPGTRYFFHIGGNHWYKNRGAVLEIFASLRQLDEYRDTRLVLAGGAMTAEMQAIALKHSLGASVLDTGVLDTGVTGRLGKEQLAALYSGALATLFPSLEEGFGWPILESQACGCPVVIADRPPMNDIAGKAGILIDPAQPQAAAVSIRQQLVSADELRAAGLRNAAQYTVHRMVEGCEQLYRQAIDECNR